MGSFSFGSRKETFSSSSFCHFDRKNWRLFWFEDDIDDYEKFAPTKENVKVILEWGSKIPENEVLLVHCEAGISRSTAAALALLVQRNRNVNGSLEWLLKVRPEAIPNSLITKYADELLGMNGELHTKAEKIANDRMKVLWNK